MIVIADEIYEQLTYEVQHCSFASLPGMLDRTVTVNGMSKSHSMTGEWSEGTGEEGTLCTLFLCLFLSFFFSTLQNLHEVSNISVQFFASCNPLAIRTPKSMQKVE